jgi:hypothetical protein
MTPRPLDLTTEQRALLAEFERLHAQWRLASAAADAIECCACADGPQIEHLLKHRLAADRVHQRAMQLLRSAPI